MGFADLVTAADRAVQAHLGGTVRYVPSIGAAPGTGVNVPGVFSAAYVRADAGTPGISTSGPAAFLRLSDLPSDPAEDEGAEVIVNGTTYTIHEQQKDGLGGVLLHLREL